MGLRELNNDQVHAVAAHLTVAEAIVQTGLPVELVVEERRSRPVNPDSRHYAVQTSHIVRWFGVWKVLTDLAR